MDIKLSTLLGLGLTLAPTLITTDLHSVQAQANCKRPPCYANYGGTRTTPGKLPPEIIQGDTYKAEGKYDLAKDSYSKALEQAIKNNDLAGQVNARKELGDLPNLTKPGP